MLRSSPLRDIALLAALCVLCFFWRLGSVGLFDMNEGLYVEAAREMVLRADYVTGRVNGVPFFDKPPLALWLDAASFHVFGMNEFAARLPVALSATALVLLTFLFGARWFGRRAGLIAAGMLALSPLYIGTARQMTMDIHQSLWVGAAMFCFFGGWIGRRPGRAWWYLAFWACCGLGFMAKSVPGLFPIGCAFVFVLLEERFRLRPVLTRIWEAQPLPGLLILAAIIAPWHILAYRQHGPYFYQQYWELHHVKLFTGQEFSHVAPFWYYVPALLAGFFPWSLFLPWAAARAARAWRDEGDSATARRFLFVWAAVFFLGFSGMTSKLLSYLLPMYAAVTLLAGDWLSVQMEERRTSVIRWITTAMALVGAAAILGARAFLARQRGLEAAHPGGLEFPPAGLLWVVYGITAAAAGAAAAAALAWNRRLVASVASVFAGMVAFVGVALEFGLPQMERYVTGPLHSMARAAALEIARGRPVAIHISGPIKPSVFFYLPARALSGPIPRGRDAHLIPDRGEKEPIVAYLDSAPKPAYVLTDTGRAEALMATVHDLTTAARDGRWVLLRADPRGNGIASSPAHHEPTRL